MFPFVDLPLDVPRVTGERKPYGAPRYIAPPMPLLTLSPATAALIGTSVASDSMPCYCCDVVRFADARRRCDLRASLRVTDETLALKKKFNRKDVLARLELA